MIKLQYTHTHNLIKSMLINILFFKNKFAHFSNWLVINIIGTLLQLSKKSEASHFFKTVEEMSIGKDTD